MSFKETITEAEIIAVRLKLREGEINEMGLPAWVETAEEWYDRNVALVGEDEAVKRFKAKAKV